MEEILLNQILSELKQMNENIYSLTTELKKVREDTSYLTDNTREVKKIVNAVEDISTNLVSVAALQRRGA